MRIILSFMVILIILSCTSTYVEQVVTPEGTTLQINGAVFEIPENSVRDSIPIRIEKKGVAKKSYEQGYRLKGESFVISPETLVFEKPLKFSLPVENSNAALGAKIGSGFVPLASSVVEGETLRAQLWHGGEYYLISKPAAYGIRDHSDTEEGLLIVSDIYVSDYIKNFKKALKQGGYYFQIWTFVYPNENSIEENALLLAGELNKLHEQYDEFRLDIVSFGVGGLIAHRYIVDSLTYQRDISPVVIAVGTPFFGSSFADIEKAKKGRSPYRFFFIDGLGEKASDIALESVFISWLKKHKRLRGGWLKEPEEDKNPASIRARKVWAGEFPEENDGDGLVSLSATMLTPIEPDPFSLGHFELFESSDVHEVVVDFVQLYRTFAWMEFFLKVWQEEEPVSKINEIWEQEVKLHFRNLTNFDVLLEINENMLKSAPKNAILITNGDYDTYPAWYLQEKGIRDDIIVVNRSLLNLNEYVRFLLKRGLPLNLSEEDLNSLKHKKKNGEFITKSDQLIVMLIKQNERPLVFSTTVYSPQLYGYPLELVGKVYEIAKEKGVDIVRTTKLLYEEFNYDKVSSVPIESLSEPIQQLCGNYASTAHELSLALLDEERYDEALAANAYAKRFVGSESSAILYYNDALIFFRLNNKEKADSAFRVLLSKADIGVLMKKNIAEHYYEMDMKEEAIRILAECLKEEPGNKEILELIKQYQEEL